MMPLSYILINRRTGEARALSLAQAEVFDYGPNPADWRIC